MVRDDAFPTPLDAAPCCRAIIAARGAPDVSAAYGSAFAAAEQIALSPEEFRFVQMDVSALEVDDDDDEDPLDLITEIDVLSEVRECVQREAARQTLAAIAMECGTEAAQMVWNCVSRQAAAIGMPVTYMRAAFVASTGIYVETNQSHSA